MAINRKHKKIALFVLLTLLVFVAACSSKNAGDSGATTNPQSNNSPKAGNKKESPTDISIMRIQWSDEKMFNPDNAIVKAINEAANVNLKYELTDATEYGNKLSLMMAGGELPDIVYAGDMPTYAEYGAQGAFLPLDEYLDKYPAVKQVLSDSVWQEVRNASPDKKIYFLPLYIGNQPFLIGYREDWLNRLGLEEPKTIAEFEEMLVKFRDGDLDGNGKKDTIPLAMSATSVFFQARDLTTMFGINWFGGWMVNPENSDEIMKTAMNPATKDYLKFMKNLRQEGLLDSEFLVGKTSGRDKFITGNVGAIIFNVNEISIIKNGLAKTDPNGKVGILNPLIGPNGDKGGMVLAGSTAGGFAINAKSKDKVDKIFKYLEWQATDGQDLINWGIESKNYNVVNGQKVLTAVEQIPADYQGAAVPKIVFAQAHTDAHYVWLESFPNEEEFDAFMVRVNASIDAGMWDVASQYKLSTEESKQYNPSIGPMIDEFATKAVLEQNYDIDQEWEKMRDKWFNSGGKQVTDSFNKQWMEKR